MKVVEYIDHPRYKITVFKSGFKHIVKFDRGEIDFSFKFLDGEVANLAELIELVRVKLIPAAEDHYQHLIASKISSLTDSEGREEDSDFPKII